MATHSRRRFLTGAGLGALAAVLPRPAVAAPAATRTHYSAIVVGTGFGGSIAAQRLSERNIDTLVLERGRAFPHDNLAKVFPSDLEFWSSDYLWEPTVRRTTGLLDAQLHGQEVVLTGACLGGGSVIYAGATVAPLRRYYDKIFPRCPGYAQMETTYWPRALRKIGASPAPADVYASDPFRHARVFDAQMAAAGMPTSPIPVAYDWNVIRAELAGQVRKSATVGEMLLGNSNGSKLEVSRTVLGQALARPTTELRTLHSVTRIGAANGRYEVDIDVLRVDGSVANTLTYTANQVFLGAGARNTTKLLLDARMTGSLPNLNEHIGTQVGDNGDQVAVRTLSGPPLPQASPLVSSAIVTDDDNYAPVRVENMGLPSGGLPVGAPALAQLTMTADWTNRTEWKTVDGQHILPFDTSMLSDAAAAANRVQQRVLERATEPMTGIHIGSIADRAVLGFTVHLLGGVPFGDATDAVGEIDGHKGLFVVDGAMIPGNAGGANPSLTISGLAEYIMDGVVGAPR